MIKIQKEDNKQNEIKRKREKRDEMRPINRRKKQKSLSYMYEPQEKIKILDTPA